jgi:nicotinate-nucleotide adenylyltransferase
MERLGVFGGTFDPPHNGHLALARAARDQFNLQTVLWVLTPDPPHKDRPDLTPYPERLAMLRSAIDGQRGFEISAVDIERPGPQYMVDTVRILRDRNPGAELFLLIGEDSLRDLPTWKEPRELLALCPIIAMHRPANGADLDALEEKLPGIRERVHFLTAPNYDLSSTKIRQMVRDGKSVLRMIPRPVAAVVEKENLYR